jgi:hypothetical protein
MLLLPCALVQASEFGAARLSYLKGDVQVFSEEADDWVPAAINTPLGEDDRIWVPEGGRAEINLRGGVYLRLDEQTGLDIVALEDDDWQFYLGKGRMYINNRQGGIDHIQIDSPRTSVSNYDNSIIMLDTNRGGLLELSVLKGYSTVETERGVTHLEAGRSLRIFEDLSAETTPLPEPDSWERWNHSRDQKQLAASESLRYIPDEIDDSASDLDEYGNWHFSSDFGYVWRPYLSLSTGWAPYRDGRWVWRHGIYTWVSYEPWGWAPYHYGRWAFVAGYGWCWVPPRRHEVVWAPGYVAWVEHHDHVAWVPLAPGEAYYGHLPRRRGAPPPPPRTEVRQVYRNITVKNSITVVNRQTFLTGKKQKVTLRENPFLAKGGSTRAPTIKPVRESTAPALRSIPANRKPPERILRTTPKQVRQERKLRRSEKDTVLRQTAPAPELPVVRRPEPRPLPREERLQYRREQAEKEKQRSRPAPKVKSPATATPQSKGEGTNPAPKATTSKPQSRTPEPGQNRPQPTRGKKEMRQQPDVSPRGEQQQDRQEQRTAPVTPPVRTSP